MLARFVLPEAFDRLTAAQHGMVSTHQLQLCGVPREAQRRLSAAWTRVQRGLYCVREPTWASATWAGVLAGGESAVLGGATAAHLHGVATAPDQIEVWLPDVARPRLDVGVYSITFHRGLRHGRGSPPRSSVEEALLDMARTVDEDSLVMAAARALSNRVTTGLQLQGELMARQRQPHRRTLGALLAESAAGVESVLEWRFHCLVERAHALPAMVRQAQAPEGRVDGLYPEYGIIIELDGRSFHDNRRDMRRDNRHALSGLITLRYGWHDMLEPCFAARQIASALRMRGWDGDVQACSRCARARL